MPVTSLDHLYAETHHWDETVAFWHGLGFEFVSRWGEEGHRAGRLESGAAAVVVAEVPLGQPAAFTAFFRLDDADDFQPGSAVDVVAPLEDTHWGTRWLRVADPDTRVYALEATED